jgi:ribonuclease HI
MGGTPVEEEAAASTPLASSSGALGKEEADASQHADSKEALSEKLASLKSIHLYVDGSFISGKIGYGFALITPSGELLFDQFGAIQDPDLRQQRQVSGELIATQQGILWCLRHHLPQVEVFYDYAGVEFWVTGAWRAKQDLTQTYRDFMRACPIKIRWHKVASHTGVHWNEHVDQLAKRGAFHGRPTPLLSRHDLPA